MTDIYAWLSLVCIHIYIPEPTGYGAIRLTAASAVHAAEASRYLVANKNCRNQNYHKPQATGDMETLLIRHKVVQGCKISKTDCMILLKLQSFHLTEGITKQNVITHIIIVYAV